MKRLAAVLIAMITACSSDEAASASTPPPAQPPPANTRPTVDYTLRLEDAAAVGAYSGVLVDDTGAPIANGTVAVGAMTTTTDASGAFSLTPPPGRALLVVSAPGKVTVSRSIGVTVESPNTRIVLATLLPAQAVPPTGGVVPLGDATLDIPSEAYPGGTSLALAWIDRAHVAATAATPLFIDEFGWHRLIAQLHIEAGAQPAAPVTLRVPFTEANAKIALYAIVDGERTERIEPTGVGDGFALFSLSHFSDYQLMAERMKQEADEAAHRAIIEATMLFVISETQLVDLTGRPYKLGDDIPSGTTLKGGRFTVFTPNGTQVTSRSDTTKLTTTNDGITTVTCELCDLQANLLKGLQAATDAFRVQTSLALFGSPGGIFSVKQKTCSAAEKSIIDEVHVSEGDLSFSLNGATLDVPSGKRAIGCEACSNPQATTCDEP